ncbi:MAG: phosphate signaling complex protein PhoU [Actinomycetota bacterium]
MTTLHPEPAHEQKGEIELRHHFDDELDELRRGLVEMLSLVAENTRRSGEVVVENRLDLVDAVIDADDPIDKICRNLEHRTFEILALQQPVASDLRFLVAMTRALYEAERSGDLAVNIAKRTAAQNGFPQHPQIQGLLARLVDESAKVFESAVEAVATLDPEIGMGAEEADDIVDTITERFFGNIHAHSQEIGLECAVELSHVGRFLERIADHGVNIAQNITYVMTGSFPDTEPSSPSS